jgi:hypothetical protein
VYGEACSEKKKLNIFPMALRLVVYLKAPSNECVDAGSRLAQGRGGAYS